MTVNGERRRIGYQGAAPAFGDIPNPDRLLDVTDGAKPMLCPIDELREFLDYGGDISQDASIRAAYAAALSYLDGPQTWLSFTQRQWQWTLRGLPYGMCPFDPILRPMVSVERVELFPDSSDPIASDPAARHTPDVTLLTAADGVEKVGDRIRFHWDGANAPAIPASVLHPQAASGYLREILIPTSAAGSRDISIAMTPGPMDSLVTNRLDLLDPAQLDDLRLSFHAPSGVADFTMLLAGWDDAVSAYVYEASDDAVAWADAVNALSDASPDCSITLYDRTDNRTILSDDRHVLNADGLICPVGEPWPLAASRPTGDSVRIQFTAGWAHGELPDDLLWAVKAAAKNFYDMRTGMNAADQFMPPAVQALLAPYQRRRSS